MKVKISDINIDHRLQSRIELDGTNTLDIKDAIERGDNIPPILLFLIDGELTLVGGWHRINAYKSLGRKEVEAVIEDGTWEDARVRAFTDNRGHGSKLAKPDLWAFFERLLVQSPYCDYSNSEVGRIFKIRHQYIAEVRQKLRDPDAYFEQKKLKNEQKKQRYNTGGGDMKRENEQLRKENQELKDKLDKVLARLGDAPQKTESTPVAEPVDNDKLLTSQEAASFLGVSEAEFMNKLNMTSLKHKLRPVKEGNNVVLRIKKSDLLSCK